VQIQRPGARETCSESHRNLPMIWEHNTTTLSVVRYPLSVIRCPLSVVLLYCRVGTSGRGVPWPATWAAGWREPRARRGLLSSLSCSVALLWGPSCPLLSSHCSTAHHLLLGSSEFSDRLHPDVAMPNGPSDAPSPCHQSLSHAPKADSSQTFPEMSPSG
jgi:hypothetical protein